MLKDKNNLDEQKIFNKVLKIMIPISLIVLFFFILLYIINILPYQIPNEQLTKSWHLNAKDFNRVNNIPSGLKLLNNLNKLDILGYIVIFLLASIIIFCLFVTAIYSFIKKDKIFASLLLMEFIVLIFASCGFVIIR